MPVQSFSSPQSSNISGARWDSKTKILEIDFKHGGTYSYEKFPKKLWEQFSGALSKGTFFYAHIIKDRNKPRFVGMKKQPRMNEEKGI